MKTLTTIALLSFLSFNYYSQAEQFSCVIDRNDYSNVYVVNETDTTYLSKDEKNRRVLNETGVTYQFHYGKGKQKDVNGIKERKKKYVIGSNQDTVLYSLYSGRIIQLNDSVTVERIKTDYGWQYMQSDSTVLCELDFMWNESSWNYNITFFNSNENTDKLKKLVMLSVVKMAAERSKCECYDADDTDSFYYLLWLTSLAKT